MFPFETEEKEKFLTVRTVDQFRLKNWPQNRSKIFCNFFFAFYSSSLKKKITHQIKSLSQKKRDERQSPFKRVYQLTTRVKLSLSRWLFEHARTSPNTRGLGRNTHTHSVLFRKLNGPQPRKDYEFSQREEFHDASFRRGVKGEQDDDDDAEEDDDDASCFRSGIFLFGR